MSQGQGGGRPLSFKSKKALDEAINNYFSEKTAQGKPFTFAGLAYYLEIDRRTLYNYRKEISPKYSKFFPSLKKAIQRINMQTEENLIDKGSPGAIFLAKNYGYTDKQESDDDNKTIQESVTYNVTVTQPKDNDTDKPDTTL